MAIAVITTVGNGPIIIAANPVPVGWPDDPATLTGMCQTEMTNTAAPMSAKRDITWGFSLRFFTIILAPMAMKTMAIRYHIIIMGPVSMPSGMCVFFLPLAVG